MDITGTWVDWDRTQGLEELSWNSVSYADTLRIELADDPNPPGEPGVTTTLCRVLGVSSSGYYAWRRRSPSARHQADARLQAHIAAIHAWSDGTYGPPRILAQLRQEGVHVGGKRVARLLRQAGLQGVSRHPQAVTTRPAKDACGDEGAAQAWPPLERPTGGRAYSLWR